MHSDSYLTRGKIGPFLRDHSIPIGDSTIDKECAPSVNTGPPVAYWWGRRPLYDPTEVLKWARARLRSSRQNRVPGPIDIAHTERSTDGTPGSVRRVIEVAEAAPKEVQVMSAAPVPSNTREGE
jgi:hypothetical protein